MEGPRPGQTSWLIKVPPVPDGYVCAQTCNIFNISPFTNLSSRNGGFELPTEVTSKETESQGSAQPKCNGRASTWADLLVDQGTTRASQIWCTGDSANAVPLTKKLRTRVTHIWGDRRVQPNRSAMEGPRPGQTSWLIKVPPVPDGYVCAQTCNIFNISPFTNLSSRNGGFELPTEVTSKETESQGSAQPKCNGRASTWADLLVDQGTTRASQIWCTGDSANAVPLTKKLRTRVTHIWGDRRVQPNRSAMEGPRPGQTSWLIKVPPVPDGYVCAQTCNIFNISPFTNLSSRNGGFELPTEVTSKETESQGSAQPKCNGRASTWADLLVDQGTTRASQIWCTGDSANAVPLTKKLRTRVTHIWGDRRVQPNRSAMEGPRPGQTSWLIKVPPVPVHPQSRIPLCESWRALSALSAMGEETTCFKVGPSFPKSSPWVVSLCV
ncbi:hypothetical protein RRG08_041680 [Elysia crispata]|uniref:Uncharacterized protein n=1 Tax=Elysia crispata TaxID=231223 RepID=A0AAE1CVI1_9GAST|nr:hypothetical protein RRG08_041680 [Elysia crispata]